MYRFSWAQHRSIGLSSQWNFGRYKQVCPGGWAYLHSTPELPLPRERLQLPGLTVLRLELGLGLPITLVMGVNARSVGISNLFPGPHSCSVSLFGSTIMAIFIRLCSPICPFPSLLDLWLGVFFLTTSDQLGLLVVECWDDTPQFAQQEHGLSHVALQ